MYQKRIRNCLVLWVIGAVLAGILSPMPAGNAAVARATETNAAEPQAKEREERHALRGPTNDDRGYVVWDCVCFGNYWQKDTNGDGRSDRRDAKTPIKWRVLSVEGDDAWLIAEQNMETRRFSWYDTDITWETSTIRSWLNGYGAEKNSAGEDFSGGGFLNEAFSPEEQQAIRSTALINGDNPSYGTDGGNDTCDKVYLLSYLEAKDMAYGISTAAEDRYWVTKNTDFVDAQAGSGNWWLRTPGYEGGLIAYVKKDGRCNLHGGFPSDDTRVVRPVLHLDLAAESAWAWAGRINSIGKVVEEADPPAGWQPSVHPAESRPPTVSPGNAAGDNSGNPPDHNADHGLKNPTINSDGVTTWDCVWFGSYWGENDSNRDNKVDQNDSKSKIMWRVLSVHGSDAFLISDTVLDCQRYNEKSEDITWETCTLRSWLNGYGPEANKQGKDYRGQGFLNNAFTETERQAIRTTTVVNEDNYLFGTEGGPDTADRIYLLSYDEVTDPAYGFPFEDTYDDRFDKGCRVARMAEYLPFVWSREAWTGNFVSYSPGFGERKYAQWWLRSPGAYQYYATCVDVFGHLTGSSYTDPGWMTLADSPDVMIRPVLHLDLSAGAASGTVALWSYAGTLCSDGRKDIKYEGMRGPGPTKTPVPKAASNTSSPKRESDYAPVVRKPRRVPYISVKPGKKKRTLTVAWGRVPGAQSYEVWYSTSPLWKKKKQKRVSKNRVTVKKLKLKKMYYVRVRAYCKKGKDFVYGPWSRRVKIKMKK